MSTPGQGRPQARRVAGRRVLVALAASGLPLAALWPTASWPAPASTQPAEVALPAARSQGAVSLEAALAQRRSLRSFAAAPLTAAEVGQLLWAAQGETSAQGRRTAPSAGATYPLVLYLVAARIEGVPAGVYRYRPPDHRLLTVAAGDVPAQVAATARGQAWLAQAPALVVVATEPSRTEARYGARAERYVAIEAGAAAQNLLLQAAALGLGGTLVGAFDDAALRAAWPWPQGEQPLAMVAVGRAR